MVLQNLCHNDTECSTVFKRVHDRLEKKQPILSSNITPTLQIPNLQCDNIMDYLYYLRMWKIFLYLSQLTCITFFVNPFFPFFYVVLLLMHINRCITQFLKPTAYRTLNLIQKCSLRFLNFFQCNICESVYLKWHKFGC